MTDDQIANDVPQCKNCRFWFYTGFSNAAECRQSAPTISAKPIPVTRGGSRIGHRVEQRGVWPMTSGDDWCGQHEPRA